TPATDAMRLPTDGPMKRNVSPCGSGGAAAPACSAVNKRPAAAAIAAATHTIDTYRMILIGMPIIRPFYVYRANRFLTTNQTLAGRSARRRMYQGNQYSPYAISTRIGLPSLAS